MVKVLLAATAVVVVVLLGVGGYFLYQNFQTKYTPQSSPSSQTTPTSVSTNQPTSNPTVSTDPCEVLTKGSSDVPPLYKEGVAWKQPIITEYKVPLGEEGSRKISGCLYKVTSISGGVSTNIRSYYFDGLKKFGWSSVVSADGPDGGLDSYQKGNAKYFVAREDIASNSNQPLFNFELFYTQ